MDELLAALCFQLPAPADTDSVDGWIPGDDGRAWRNPNPQGLVAAFNAARPMNNRGR